MMKRFILALSTFFILLPTFVAAAPDPVRTIARVFGREYRNFAGVRAPLYAYVLVTIIIWTILYMAVNLLPLVKNSDNTSRIAMVLSLAIALFTILSSSFVSWFYVFFGGFLWLLGIIAVVGIAYLFWHSMSWMHTKSTEAWYGDMEKVAKAGEKKANALKQKAENFKNIKETKKERQKLAKKYARDKFWGGEIGGKDKEEQKKKTAKHYEGLKKTIHHIHIPVQGSASIEETIHVLHALITAVPDKEHLKEITSDKGREYLQELENKFGQLSQRTPKTGERYKEEHELLDRLDRLRNSPTWRNIAPDTRTELEAKEQQLLDQAERIKAEIRRVGITLYRQIAPILQQKPEDESEAKLNSLRDYLDKESQRLGQALSNYLTNAGTFANRLQRFAMGMEQEQEINQAIADAEEHMDRFLQNLQAQTADQWFHRFMSNPETLTSMLDNVIHEIIEFAESTGTQRMVHTEPEREFLKKTAEALQLLKNLHQAAEDYVNRLDEYKSDRAQSMVDDQQKQRILANMLSQLRLSLAEAIRRDLAQLSGIINAIQESVTRVGRNPKQALQELKSIRSQFGQLQHNFNAAEQQVLKFINEFIEKAKEEKKREEKEQREHDENTRREAREQRQADLREMIVLLRTLDDNQRGPTIEDLLNRFFGNRGNNQNQ